MGLKLLGSAPSGTVDASTKAYADTKATKWIANFFGRDQGRDPLLFERFNDKADGTPPLLFDSGQVADWTLTPAVAPAVSGGVLGSSAVGASYYRSAALGATCTEIGGRFTITPGSATRTTAGSAVLGIGTGPIVTSGGVVINMSCHALFYKEGWSYGIWESGAYVALAGDTYLVALPDDGVTEYEACVQINGTTATIFSPDGNVTSVTDARIGTYAGQYPFFETFRPAATDDHDRWASIWANTGTPKRRAQSGAWINRTIAQLKTDLGLTGTNSGDQTVIPKRVTSATTTSTLTPNADTTDVCVLTAQNGALTIAAPTGTPVNEQQLSIRIKAATAAGAITHNAAYIDSGVATRPTTTVLNKTIRLGYIYDSTAAKWVLMAVDAVGY